MALRRNHVESVVAVAAARVGRPVAALELGPPDDAHGLAWRHWAARLGLQGWIRGCSLEEVWR